MTIKAARRVYVFWTLFVFGLYVYLDAKGWIGRSAREREKRLRRQGARLRERLIRLGPTFIKMGQMLATRADLLPLEYIDELASLQDNVPPYPNRQAMKLIQDELGRPASELFSEMSDAPIASASLGQVYRARLLTGEVVAVKVQRPCLEALIARDLD
ncbi:MAG TPA: AarF/UbiB family protein, partial [Blastocatellia bacterium]|nr:AarF/UbiB family protein [Blastocatellia bacterium]